MDLYISPLMSIDSCLQITVRLPVCWPPWGRAEGVLRFLQSSCQLIGPLHLPLAIVSLPSGFIFDFACDEDSAVHTQAGVCFVLLACSAWMRDVPSSLYIPKSEVHRLSSQCALWDTWCGREYDTNWINTELMIAVSFYWFITSNFTNTPSHIQSILPF